MLVTPRVVRSLRVFWMESSDTSAMGTTPTTSSAPRTFCQNRGRSQSIPRDLPRTALVVRSSLCELARARASHPNGCRSYRKRASTRRSAHEARAAARIPQESAQHALRRLEILAVGIGQTGPFRIDSPPTLEAPEALVADPQTREIAAGAARL